MAETTVLVLFLCFVLGGILLMLVPVYLEAEEARKKREAARRAAASPATEVFAMPGFFARPDASQIPSTSLAFDDALVARLEDHVRAEQAIVKQFVHYPSLDALYRPEGQNLRPN